MQSSPHPTPLIPIHTPSQRHASAPQNEHANRPEERNEKRNARTANDPKTSTKDATKNPKSGTQNDPKNLRAYRRESCTFRLHIPAIALAHIAFAYESDPCTPPETPSSTHSARQTIRQALHEYNVQILIPSKKSFSEQVLKMISGVYD